MSHIEMEYKVLIDKDDFYKLESQLSDKKYELFIQTNYYYDTINRDLKKNNLSLRIRYIENKNVFIATLKENKKNCNIEHEFVVLNNSFSALPKQIIDIIDTKNIDKSKIIQLAFLTTIRKEYHDNEFLLCLDHNKYNQCEDYEIECEANSILNAKKYIDNLLSTYQIKYKESKYSKSARAIKSL